ncbi:hypothetical protein APHAL10511_007843 [Amanita phalloides]|nr:hypothetical protein APHAL10511_007843 [Amanita phalloides]
MSLSGTVGPTRSKHGQTILMNDFDVVADSEGEEFEYQVQQPRALSSIETAETRDGDRPISPIVTTSLGTTTSTRMPDIDFRNVLSIADRAKTRQRSTKQSLPTTRGPLPFDHGDDDPFNSYLVPETRGGLEISPSHSKSRPKPRPKSKQRKSVEAWDDSDSFPVVKVGHGLNPFIPAADPHTPGREQPPSPASRTRPKPRPIKRIPKPSTTEAVENQQLTSQLSLPAPPTSPLPPSDPPPPTSTVQQYVDETSGLDIGIPPIETLPEPPSSPSSLFSTADQDAGPSGHAHIHDAEDDPLLLGPPSTFFTGSSSPDLPPPPPPEKSKAKRADSIEVIDLCTVPPRSTDVQVLTMKKAVVGRKGKEKEKSDARATEKGKSKAKGKRKANDEDEYGFDVDGEDEEYDEGRKGKKAKAVAARKGKEKAGKKATAKKKIPEVAADAPPPKRIAKAKAKEKEKEFPDGVAREDGAVDQVAGPSTTVADNTGERRVSLSPVPDSEGEDMLDVDATRSEKTEATPTSSGSKRQRKIVEHERDEADEREEESISPKKKARTRVESQAKTQKTSTRLVGKKNQNGKGGVKGKRVVASDDDDDIRDDYLIAKPSKKKSATVLSSDEDGDIEVESFKENVHPQISGSGSSSSSGTKPKPPPPRYSSPIPRTDNDVNVTPASTSLTSRYTIAPKTKSTPMSELIRRVNSLPHSPFSSGSPAGKGGSKSTPMQSGLRVAPRIAYSPYLKSSRSFLSRIAPLHPNRRTPPPPPPPPPPRKKSKKEIEREERWEDELIEGVGGPAAWSCLPEEDRKEMRKAKLDQRDLTELNKREPIVPLLLIGGGAYLLYRHHKKKKQKQLKKRKTNPIISGEPITATIIYPFINQFVRETGVTGGDERTTGYFAGIIESTFFLSEALTVVFWGMASDRFGRRPVLLLGPLGLSLVMIGFGMSTEFSWLVIFRTLQGMLNGNIGVSKAVIGELTDSTNMADAFAVISLMWCTGVTIAPFLGGLLSRPAERWPDTLGRLEYLRNHPFFLPCLAASVVSFFSFLAGFIALKETSSTAILQQERERNVKLASQTPLLLGKDAVNYGTNKTQLAGLSQDVEGGQNPAHAKDHEKPSLRGLLTSEAITLLINYSLFTFLEMSTQVLLPLVWSTSVEHGGLGFTPYRIGMTLGAYGGMVHEEYTSSPFRVCFCPSRATRLRASSLGAQEAPTGRCGVLSSSSSWDTSRYLQRAVQVMVQGVAPSKSALGAMNGMAQAVACSSRSFAPSIASSLHAISLQRRLAGGNAVYYILLAMVAMGIRLAVALPRKFHFQ